MTASRSLTRSGTGLSRRSSGVNWAQPRVFLPTDWLSALLLIFLCSSLDNIRNFTLPHKKKAQQNGILGGLAPRFGLLVYVTMCAAAVRLERMGTEALPLEPFLSLGGEA